MIGAGATVATATFQLFMAFRARKADSRPKRSNGIRSTMAVFGLVLGAAVAGFAYSELRKAREREQTIAMEQRISDRLQARADEQLAQLRDANGAGQLPVATAGGPRFPARSEATVHVAACRSQSSGYGNGPIGCDAANANRVALCASVPSQASVLEVQLFAHADGSSPGWEQSRVTVDQDIGGARFVESTYEMEEGADWKAICANFTQWSSERGHAARVVVVYTTGPAISVATETFTADSDDSDLPARAVDAGAGGAPREDLVAPDVVSADPAHGAAEAVIAAQP
jgi:hypothetical protein